jgi:hypothetical protein
VYCAEHALLFILFRGDDRQGMEVPLLAVSFPYLLLFAISDGLAPSSYSGLAATPCRHSFLYVSHFRLYSQAGGRLSVTFQGNVSAFSAG